MIEIFVVIAIACAAHCMTPTLLIVSRLLVKRDLTAEKTRDEVEQQASSYG